MKTKNRKIWLLVLLVIAIPIAWYLISPAFIVVEKNEEFPIQEILENENTKMETKIAFSVVKEAVFLPKAHEVKGKALVINDNGKLI